MQTLSGNTVTIINFYHLFNELLYEKIQRLEVNYISETVTFKLFLEKSGLVLGDFMLKYFNVHLLIFIIIQIIKIIPDSM